MKGYIKEIQAAVTKAYIFTPLKEDAMAFNAETRKKSLRKRERESTKPSRFLALRAAVKTAVIRLERNEFIFEQVNQHLGAGVGLCSGVYEPLVAVQCAESVYARLPIPIRDIPSRPRADIKKPYCFTPNSLSPLLTSNDGTYSNFMFVNV
jgi:hypothetical protein